MSNKEREAQIEELGRRAVRTPNPYEGIKAIEALAAYGEAAIPKLLEVGNDSSIADPVLNKQLTLKSAESKKELNTDIINLEKVEQVFIIQLFGKEKNNPRSLKLQHFHSNKAFHF